MAGDWIKMETELPEKPEVVKLSAILGIDRFSVVGRLHRFWSWWNKHSRNGHADGVTETFLDDLVILPGFSDALRKVDWLEARSGSLSIPRFDRHNGQSAKERSLATERKRMSRQCHDSNVTETRPEKRREEKIDTPESKRRREDTPDEILTEPQALEQSRNAGVPEDFARWIFQDWHCRGGKDAGGVKVSWAGYAKKRWNRERIEWEAGTHKGKTRPGKATRSEADRDRANTGLEPVKPKYL